MPRKTLVLLLVILFSLPAVGWAKGSVICIHGFLRSYKCMRSIGIQIQKCGFEVCLWNYPSREFTIEEHAQDLLVFLKRRAREKPGEPIHFVCHSLGSLVLRATLSLPDCPEEAKIGRAILLAPPNRGSQLAQSFKSNFIAESILGKRTGYELMHYGECDIICLGSFPPTKDVLVIAGTKGVHYFDRPNDGILTIDETILNTPFCFSKVYVSHGKIMENPQTIYLVRQFLLSYHCPNIKNPCSP